MYQDIKLDITQLTKGRLTNGRLTKGRLERHSKDTLILVRFFALHKMSVMYNLLCSILEYVLLKLLVEYVMLHILEIEDTTCLTTKIKH